MQFGGRRYINRGTSENPIYDLSDEASGGSGSSGSVSYICSSNTGRIATNASPQTSSGNWTVRYVEYYFNFRRLDSSLPEIDLETMLYYTTSDDQGAERTLMPVVSTNPDLNSSFPPEFIGKSGWYANTHSSLGIPATLPNALYQLKDRNAYFINPTWADKDYYTSFTRTQAKHYFIVNDAGTFYLQRLASGSADTFIYLNKIAEDWTPDSA